MNQRLLPFFFGKENTTNPIGFQEINLLGPAPKPPWFRFAEGLGSPYSSAKQNKRFLLLFLEKEELNQPNIL
jgi:hypothetical protein